MSHPKLHNHNIMIDLRNYDLGTAPLTDHFARATFADYFDVRQAFDGYCTWYLVVRPFLLALISQASAYIEVAVKPKLNHVFLTKHVNGLLTFERYFQHQLHYL